MELKLVEKDDSILTTTCQDFDFENPQIWPIEFAKELVKFMYDNNGIGISANQVGEPYKVMAMCGYPENFVCFNPRIVQYSEQQVVLEENCLTYPGLLVKIKRPQHIRARFRMANGDVRTDTFTGLSARIFQHQLDYLNGIKFYDRANKYHKEQAFKRWNK
jgi:peptide deformylase